ncbi:MAG: polysaccharide deacetylase family protein [Desulfobacterales bacterium]|nr:polysaccharide deacetylase family protein [Desulfobacterales bacterium]
MTPKRPGNGPFSTPAARAGLAALVVAAGLALASPHLAILPLAVYLLACMVFPFCPCTRFFLPVICRGNADCGAVALTFDDGPDPATTPALLDFLAEHRVHATFFVTGRKAQAHPELIRRIIERGHDIGNHSFGHDTLVMFKGKKRIDEEIGAAQAVLESLGVLPRAFRPPAGITYPGLGPALDRYGLVAVNYSRRAMDRGNRRIDGLAAKILTPLASGDIIMLHDIAPPDPARLEPWLNEIKTLLLGIDSKGIRIRPLAEITRLPVAPG